jgi:hypothetical protein
MPDTLVVAISEEAAEKRITLVCRRQILDFSMVPVFKEQRPDDGHGHTSSRFSYCW